MLKNRLESGKPGLIRLAQAEQREKDPICGMLLTRTRRRKLEG